MEDQKAKKYSENWFREESNQLKVAPSLDHFNRVQSKLGRRRWTRQITRWSSAAAAVVLVAATTWFALPQMNHTTQPIVELKVDQASPYFQEFGSFLQSDDYRQYRDLQKAYSENQTD